MWCKILLEQSLGLGSHRSLQASQKQTSLSPLFPNPFRCQTCDLDSLSLPVSHVLAISPEPQSEDLGAYFLEDFKQCSHSNLRDDDFLTLWVTLWRLSGRRSFYLALWVKTKQLTSIPQNFMPTQSLMNIESEIKDLFSCPKTLSLSNSPLRYSGAFSTNALTQW